MSDDMSTDGVVFWHCLILGLVATSMEWPL